MALPATSRLALLGGGCVSQFFFFLDTWHGLSLAWNGLELWKAECCEAIAIVLREQSQLTPGGPGPSGALRHCRRHASR